MLDATIQALLLFPLIFLAWFAQLMILDGCDDRESNLEMILDGCDEESDLEREFRIGSLVWWVRLWGACNIWGVWTLKVNVVGRKLWAVCRNWGESESLVFPNSRIGRGVSRKLLGRFVMFEKHILKVFSKQFFKEVFRSEVFNW